MLLVAALVASLLSTTSTANAVTVPDEDQCTRLGDLELDRVIALEARLVTSGEAAGQSGLPEFCRVSLTVAPAINIEVWLPTDTYNRRFQAVGNGGYAGTISFPALGRALRDGYATASTDTGHTPAGGSFALDENGNLNWGLIKDFASRSLIEMTRKADGLVSAFYGTGAKYSYWNGCSTGGRQGLMLAQRFPKGYDGILAGAPAINWDRFIPVELWPQVVMQQELDGPIEQCKLGVATAAAVAHCDMLDGVADGVLEDPRLCDFNAAPLIGASTDCGVITRADAVVINKIWNGARGRHGTFLWYGLPRGAPLSALAGVAPFPIPVDHFRYWVEQDPTFDWTTLDYARFEKDFRTSQKLYNDVIGTDDPDLSGFRKSGGKLLMWHGWSDQLIFAEGTVDYYERVVDTMPGDARTVGKYARLFMAPGVAHCGGGNGPNTFDAFASLVAWVERGKAPDRIEAARVENGEVVRTRPLCPYPLVARYDGRGDTNDANSFDCRSHLGRWRS